MNIVKVRKHAEELGFDTTVNKNGELDGTYYGDVCCAELKIEDNYICIYTLHSNSLFCEAEFMDIINFGIGIVADYETVDGRLETI